MKKRILSTILAVVMLVTMLPAYTISSFAEISGDFWYEILEDGTAEITGYTGSATELVIPSTIDGYMVTEIGSCAFYFCESLTSVAIPDSVTTILDSAFESCTNLTSVTFSNNVIIIGDYAFYGCTNLKDVYYLGIEEQWGEISIGSNNSPLLDATIYYEYSGNCGDNITWIFDDKSGVLTISGTGEMYDYTATTQPWKEYKNDIKEVVVSNSVTTIGNYAFYGCTSLANVTFGDSVTTIGDRAFYNCTKLTDITIPDNVKSIGNYTFYRCTSLTTVTIPDNVTILGDYAFSGCSNLTNVTIGQSVTTIGDRAFLNCTKLANLTIPNSVKSIGNYGFYKCTSLTSVNIPNGVTSIGDYAFSGCSNLANITIPDSVTSIGSFAFSNTEYYDNETNWKSDVLYINNHLIVAKTTISGLCIINFGTKTIAENAFFNCKNFTSIVIPNSVISIGDKSFSGCTSLADVYYLETEEKWNNISIGLNNNSLLNANIHYESKGAGKCGDSLIWILDGVGNLTISGTGDMYDYNYNTVPWKYDRTYIENVIISSGVTKIGSYAFSGCDSLTNVTIPDSVTTIGDSAFYNCTSLTSATIPDSVTLIGDFAFYYCTSLTSVTIPDSVTTIGEDTFYNCASLTSVTIGNGVTTISEDAFDNCYSLESITIDSDNKYYSSDECGVLFNKDKTTLIQYPKGNTRKNYTIPDSVKTIGNNAFYNCYNLTNVTIPDSVTTIGYNAFYYCTSLTSATIPDSVTSIGDSAFYNCTSLTSLKIGESVTTIGNRAFYNCTSLTSVTIPDSVTTIGAYLFYNCTSLANITIPDAITKIEYLAFYNTAYYNDAKNWENKVLYIGNHLIKATSQITGSYAIKEGTKTIGDEAFYTCSSLTSVTIPNSVTTIGDYAFYNCTKLTSVTIPNSVTTIGDYAFYNCTKLTSVAIPDSVTSIGNGAFYYCTSLQSITIPDSVTSIGYNAFCYCTSLTSLKIGESVTTIGDRAFYNCTSLKGVTIPDSVLTIGSDAFSHCEKIQYANLGNGVVSIGAYAFAYCYSLTSVTIPKSINTISHAAFFEIRKYSNLLYVYYCGTQEDWNKISIGSNNELLREAYIRYEYHKYVSVVTPPTCAEQGYTTYTCKCGDTYVADYVDINPLSHTFGEWQVTVEPIFESEGQKERVCAGCGTVETESIPALNTVLGDLNGDGAIDSDDYTMILAITTLAYAPTEEELAKADINQDGTVDAFDAIYLDLYIAGMLNDTVSVNKQMVADIPKRDEEDNE